MSTLKNSYIETWKACKHAKDKKEAFGQLYSEHFSEIYVFFRKTYYQLDEDTANDLLQEGFKFIMENIDNLPEVLGNVRSYLIGIFKNILRNQTKKAKTHQRIQKEILCQIDPADYDSPDQSLLLKEIRRQIDVLPNKQHRQVLNLAIAGYSNKDISVELGCDTARVSRIKYRARAKLSVLNQGFSPYSA